MTQSRGQNYESQREWILARAAALFAQRGYHGVSMNDLAEACGLGKATLYHYYKDKGEVLCNIADAHVSRLVELCRSVFEDDSIRPEHKLETLIGRFMKEYAVAQNPHRVLTEDVRFLAAPERQQILDKERYVVLSFANAIGLVRPDAQQAELEKPLAMLLFGMLNWMFTWLKPDGKLSHEALAPLVVDLFLHGLANLGVPAAKPRSRAAPAARTRPRAVKSRRKSV
jgi:AcrR family transcriptional regulator